MGYTLPVGLAAALATAKPCIAPPPPRRASRTSSVADVILKGGLMKLTLHMES
jgi:hypothetical protein